MENGKWKIFLKESLTERQCYLLRNGYATVVRGKGFGRLDSICAVFSVMAMPLGRLDWICSGFSINGYATRCAASL